MYKKILLINPFGIGDILFTTPLIHTLKDAFPDAKIGYLCNRRTLPILQNNPFIDSLFVYERDEFEILRKQSFFLWFKSMLGFLNRIKEEHFDIALDFSLHTQYGFFTWYAGIRKRIGYDYKGRGWLLTKRIKLQGYSDKHIVEYYAKLIKYLNLDLKYKKLELFLKEDDKKSIEKMLVEKNIKEGDILVGLIPGGGASWAKDAYLKHWPIRHFAELADKIVERYKAKIIIMGDFSEKEISQGIVREMKNESLDLSGETNLGEFASLLDRMDLVITNDGGPLHIAVALGKKTVSFFGPVDPRAYGPYPPDKNHIVLRETLDCSPCYRNFRLSSCLRNKACLAEIDVEQALNAVSKLL